MTQVFLVQFNFENIFKAKALFQEIQWRFCCFWFFCSIQPCPENLFLYKICSDMGLDTLFFWAKMTLLINPILQTIEDSWLLKEKICIIY